MYTKIYTNKGVPGLRILVGLPEKWGGYNSD